MGVADVRGKAVLVVGGSRGIGRAIGERFAELGAEVGLTGRSAEGISAVADELAEAHGQPVSGHALDVADRARIREVVEEFEAGRGRIDALVYNAGISPAFTSAEKIDDETWDDIIATNLTGAFVAARAFARRLIDAGRPGSVVFIGSVDSVVGDPRLAAYTASKSGMAGLARTMAVDWARYGIRVNTVAPGYVATDLTAGLQDNEKLRRAITDKTPMNRLAEPKEISDVVVFLASESSTFITGAVYPVDGGWTAW